LSIFPYVRAEYQAARQLAEEALSLAQQTGDALLEALGHWHVGFVLFCLGDYTTASSHLQQVISFYKPKEHHHSFVFLRGVDVGVGSLAYDACCLWCLGYPEQAFRRSREALTLAHELDHAFSLADVLCYAGCLFDELRRNAPAMKDDGEALIRLTEKMDVLSFRANGICYLGEALSKLGKVKEGLEQMSRGLEMMQSFNMRCTSSGILAGLAEAQAKAGYPEQGLNTLSEAFNLVEETDERYYEAELHRLHAELLLIQGDESAAEVSLRKAIEVARGQSAKSWELRAAIDLARLWQKQDRVDEARETLAGIYGWFTEGFDTPDLREARALLQQLL
jgi:predicted ATPase